MNLGRAAEIDSGVASLADFPVDVHFEVAVIFGGAEGIAVAEVPPLFHVQVITAVRVAVL